MRIPTTPRPMMALLAVCFLLPGLASSQAVSWMDFSGSPACSYIVESGSGTLFGINGSSNAIISSTDGGGTWFDKGLTGNYIDYLAGNPKAGTVILGRYENSYYEIMLSMDTGATWNRLPFNTVYWPGNFMVGDRGEIYALLTPLSLSSSTQLMQCKDNIWSLIGNPVSLGGTGYPTVAAVDHANNIFFGTRSSGLFYSTDGGTTWNNCLNHTPGSITAVCVDASNRIIVGTQPEGDISNGGVFVSSDTGKTWKTIGLFGFDITGLTADNDGIIYASSLTFNTPRPSTGNLYRNVPDTTLWDNIGPSHDGFASILYASSGNLLAAEPSLTVYRSTDKGNTWLNNTIRDKDIFTLAADDSGDIYAGTLGSGIYKTQGGGINNWREILFGSTCDYIYSIVPHGKKIFAATDCGMFCTADRGTTWKNLTSGSFNYPTYSVAFSSGDFLFAATIFGVYRSADSGKSWQPAGLGTHKILKLAFDSRDRLFALTDQAGVYRSTDDGASWTSMGIARNDVLTLAIDGSDRLFVGENGGVNRSTDHGVTWQVFPIARVNVFSLAFRGISKIYAATSSGVYSSPDGGATWRRNWQPSDTLVLSLTFDPRGNLFAGTYRGSVYKSIQIITGIELSPTLPGATHLDQNYPNPFNPSTVIRYQLAAKAHVTLAVYNILGERVASLVDGIQEAGERSAEWKTGGIPSGVYFYRLAAGSFAETKKMLLMR